MDVDAMHFRRTPRNGSRPPLGYYRFLTGNHFPAQKKPA